MLTQIQAACADHERRGGEGWRHDYHRSLLEAPDERSSLPARMGAAFIHVVRQDRHSLTDDACRLPNGKLGLVAVVEQGGEWTLVCRVA
jgi:hypothetical protein